MTDASQDGQSGKNEEKTCPPGRLTPCLFLIDVSANPEAATAIGDYITVRGKMEIIQNLVVGKLAETGDSADRHRMESALIEGLGQATCAMVLISPKSANPWWLERVAALCRSAGVTLTLLTLKGVPESSASYGAFKVLQGIKSLNEYIFRVSPEVDRIIFNNPEYGGLMAHTAPHHPLDAFLDWEK